MNIEGKPRQGFLLKELPIYTPVVITRELELNFNQKKSRYPIESLPGDTMLVG